MPTVSILTYRTASDEVPVVEWIQEQERSTKNRIYAALTRLRDAGHEARRPLVENLGDGIYELRIRAGRVNYRILFSFFGRTAVALAHGFTKEDVIPVTELTIAKQRRTEYENDPSRHLMEMEV